MERIRNKIFSVDEANRLLPILEEALEALAALAREATSLRRDVEVLGAIAETGATDDNPDVLLLREKVEAHAATVARYRAALAGLTEHGCILRDLELGLIDFYTMSQGRVVCLCWRRGESRIEHWHPLDQGFSGRRPLSELT